MDLGMSPYGALQPSGLGPMAPQPGMAPMQMPDFNAILGQIVQQHMVQQQAEQQAKMLAAMQGQQMQQMQPQPQPQPQPQMQPQPQPMPQAFGAPTQPANQAMLPMHSARYSGGPTPY